MSRRPSKKTTKRHAAKSARKPLRKTAKATKKVKKASASPVSAAPSTVMRDRAVTQLKFARSIIMKLMGGFTDSQYVTQPPGMPNHLLWTLGHLASTAAWAASLVDSQPIGMPEDWDKKFGMDSTPVGDAAAYPSFDEVKRRFEETHERLLAAIGSMNDAQLQTPPASNGFGFINDKLDAAFKCAWHEGWHVGQVADLRRGLGMPRAMGG